MKCFERVIVSLPNEMIRLVQLKYWDCPRTLTDDGIALELHMDKRTLYRYTNGILLALAKEMGLVD